MIKFDIERNPQRAFLEKKLYPPPVKDIDFFEIDRPEFPVKFTVTPWKSMFFPQFLVYPPGIPTIFPLPPWNFPLISLTGVLQFFSGKAQCLQD